MWQLQTGINGQKAKQWPANEHTVSLNKLVVQPDFAYDDGELSDDDNELSDDDDTGSDSSIQPTLYIPPLRSKQ